MCSTGKVEYKTQAEARVVLATFRLSRRQNIHTEQRSYKCPLCPYWHLTSQKEKHRTNESRGEMK